MDDKYDMLLLEDDIAIDLDIAMSVRREGIAGKPTPDGILTRFSETIVRRIIRQIETSPEPTIIDLGFLLLELGEDTITTLNKGLEGIVRRTQKDGKNHDITLGFQDR